MKIACLIASVSRKAGGLHESVRRLCQSLHSHPGTEVHVLGMADEYTHDDVSSWAPLPTHVFPVHGPRDFGYAPRLKEKLFELDVDILLTHGLWMYPTAVALAWHRRTGRPFVIHPHGMLDSWAINNSCWKKRLAGFFHENSCLQKAACLRALCQSEADSIRAYGLSNPICVIPNGMDLPDSNIVMDPAGEGRKAAGRKVLLYLGRIHPKKGLPNLLRAWDFLRKWGSLQAGDWDLVIAGWSQNGHEQELKNLARQLGIATNVHFPGPQFGPEKAAAYDQADAFILPSLSEGLPMVVLEAWAHGLPVVMTPQCHLAEGFGAGAAICTEPEAASIAKALKKLFLMDEVNRRRMGRRGRLLVAERFDWSGIGAQMHEVCQRLVDETGPSTRLQPEKKNLSIHESSFV